MASPAAVSPGKSEYEYRQQQLQATKQNLMREIPCDSRFLDGVLRGAVMGAVWGAVSDVDFARSVSSFQLLNHRGTSATPGSISSKTQFFSWKDRVLSVSQSLTLERARFRAVAVGRSSLLVAAFTGLVCSGNCVASKFTGYSPEHAVSRGMGGFLAGLVLVAPSRQPVLVLRVVLPMTVGGFGFGWLGGATH